MTPPQHNTNTGSTISHVELFKKNPDTYLYIQLPHPLGAHPTFTIYPRLVKSTISTPLN